MQDTLKSPPSENRTMKKATLFSIMITTSFYMLCGFLGYAAFGENTPGNLLTRFGFYEPYWLIDFANACIVVHLVGAYQVRFFSPFLFLQLFLSTETLFVPATTHINPLPYALTGVLSTNFHIH